MKKNVPIYTADIIMLRFSVSGAKNNIHKSIGEVLLKNVVVKGFSISDIEKRCKKKLNEKANKIKKLGNNQYYQVSKITLLKQHGYGIND